MDKPKLTKIILCSLVVITGIVDFLTFAIHPEFWIFDMSPLVILTHNIVTIFLVKFGVIAGLCWLMFKANAADIWKFLWIMMCVYLIFAQTMGSISNRQVAEINPPAELAPTPQEAVKTNYSFAWLYAYFPMIFALISFKLWELCFVKEWE